MERRFPLTVTSVVHVKGNRYKFKMQERITLSSIRHEGFDYQVIRNLGRGLCVAKRIGEVKEDVGQESKPSDG